MQTASATTINQINERAAKYAAEDGNVKNALWTAANEFGYFEVHTAEDGETAIFQNGAGHILNCWYIGAQSDQITEGGAGFDDQTDWYAPAPVIPASKDAWLASLEPRTGWTGWDAVGTYVTEGVQNWSVKGDELTSVGVWGTVEETEGWNDETDQFEAQQHVNYSVYVGNSREPHKTGFESADEAMTYAERTFPEMF